MSVSILDTMTRRFGRAVSIRGAKMTSKGIGEKLAATTDKARAIVTTAEKEDRDLTTAEKADFDRLMAEVKDLKRDQVRIDALEAEEEWLAGARIDARIAAGNLHGTGGRLDGAGPLPASWSDKDGEQVYCLAPGQRLADLPGSDRFSDIPYAFGQAIVAAATGQWKRLPPELRDALGENANQLGGVLVPEELSRRIIDAARAKMVLVRAGAYTLPMASDRATVARVHTDPTHQVKAENEPFNESAIIFDNVGLTAYLIGTYGVASRELLEDALNAAKIIEETLVRSLAAELDRQMLVGSGSAEMTGILNYPGIGSTGSIGAIAWGDLLAAQVAIQALNHEPNGYIVSPTIAGDLNALTSGDGTNAAALWQGPPPGVSDLTRYVTSNMPDTDILVGLFSQVMLGLRQDAVVEFSAHAGETFQRHQVAFKVTWRGDVAVEHAAAFHKLGGITT